MIHLKGLVPFEWFARHETSIVREITLKCDQHLPFQFTCSDGDKPISASSGNGATEMHKLSPLNVERCRFRRITCPEIGSSYC